MSKFCRYGEHRVADGEALQATRTGGGNYRRPSRGYRSTICREHAEELLRHTTPGHRKVANWSIVSLELATGKKRETIPWETE